MENHDQTNGTKCNPPSLAQLGQSIKYNTDKIDAYLKGNRLPNPSFTLGSPASLNLPPDLEALRQNLFDDMEHLTAMLRGPVEHVVSHTSSVAFTYPVVLFAIERFRIAEYVPLDGSPISISTLAKTCQLDESDLTRLLRSAIAHRTFEAVGSSSVRHNAVSAAIAQPDLRFFLASARQDLVPAAFKFPEALATFPGESGPEQTAFALTDPERTPMFEKMKKDPVMVERFAGAMRLLGRVGAAEVPKAVQALHFDDLPQGATVVDIGGSRGEVTVQILRRYKHLQGIVQDLPSVVAQAETPGDLAGRLTFQAHDFFIEQPVKGADVYFLRKILHDWSDEYAQKILKQLVPALKSGSRIVVNEICVPPAGRLSVRKEQGMRGWDLVMKWLVNGKEREESEWRGLFAGVDERFGEVRVRKVEGGSGSVIEAVWKG